MRKVYFIPLILILISNNVLSQCYKSAYDVLEEKLCLKDGSFEFELIDPLDPNIIVKGKYIKNNDTLIFNPGINQSELVASNSRLETYEQNGKFIKLVDNNKKSLSFVNLIMNGNHKTTNKDGLIQIKTEFPKELAVNVSRISNEMWPNPYQKQYFDIKTGYESGNGNLLIIELNLEKEFKKSFEHETKLLMKDEKLYYVLSDGKVMDFYFNKLN
ncbi:hypothetical protein D1815_02185 [Aquimarina sp. AD1]|uniref:hypothetical protein n=1 Tax=Aquimarina sp. (strain AD1) TaxID=1714848 RepID=UPI000E4B8E3A|nr:hypothetical protein [Aquimarina sp. AD1]AXT54615.1 hypothetical protein D1815_02185 [Aquimarina sp. AD1]RKN14737.1 hypothetical protein D7035_16710 [Aquimarina sp. AD1]